MPFEESTVSPQARQRYIRAGKAFSSTETLAQANKTLKAISTYGPLLVRFGFGPADVQRLIDVRDALVADRVGRGEAIGARRTNRRARRQLLAEARQEREGARIILSGAARDLQEAGGPAAEAALGKIEAALAATARAPAYDGAELSDQLEHLRLALADATVAAAAAGRGGPEALADLQAAIAALRAAEQERATGNGAPAQTERLDLLDGIVVTLARSARRAARTAARRLSKPAMVIEFELTALYGSRGSEGSDAPAETGTEEPAPAEESPAEPPAPPAV